MNTKGKYSLSWEYNLLGSNSLSYSIIQVQIFWLLSNIQEPLIHVTVPGRNRIIPLRILTALSHSKHCNIVLPLRASSYIDRMRGLVSFTDCLYTVATDLVDIFCHCLRNHDGTMFC